MHASAYSSSKTCRRQRRVHGHAACTHADKTAQGHTHPPQPHAAHTHSCTQACILSMCRKLCMQHRAQPRGDGILHARCSGLQTSQPSTLQLARPTPHMSWPDETQCCHVLNPACRHTTQPPTHTAPAHTTVLHANFASTHPPNQQCLKRTPRLHDSLTLAERLGQGCRRDQRLAHHSLVHE